MSTLRDRFHTRQVSSALTAPRTILVAGLGASAAAVLGAPVLMVPLAAAAGWAAVVALAVGTAKPGVPGIDPDLLPAPWSEAVRDAMDASKAYQQALAKLRPGPTRTRLEQVGRRVEDGVKESFRIAGLGADFDVAASKLEDPEALRYRIGRLGSRTDDIGRAIRAALQSQIDTAERIATARIEAFDRLALLDARLKEVVARVVEIGLTASATEPGVLGEDIETVVSDMEALRQAMEQIAAIG